MLSSKRGIAVTPLNPQHLSLPAQGQASQNPSLNRADDHQATCLTKEPWQLIVAVEGRTIHSFIRMWPLIDFPHSTGCPHTHTPMDLVIHQKLET